MLHHEFIALRHVSISLRGCWRRLQKTAPLLLKSWSIHGSKKQTDPQHTVFIHNNPTSFLTPYFSSQDTSANSQNFFIRRTSFHNRAAREAVHYTMLNLFTQNKPTTLWTYIPLPNCEYTTFFFFSFYFYHLDECVYAVSCFHISSSWS